MRAGSFSCSWSSTERSSTVSGVSRSSKAICSTFTWGPGHQGSAPEGTLPLRSHLPPRGRSTVQGPKEVHVKGASGTLLLLTPPGTRWTPPRSHPSQSSSRQRWVSPLKPPAPLTREDHSEEAGARTAGPSASCPFPGRPAPSRGAPPPQPHLLPLELLALAQKLDEQARALQVMPQPLPVLELLFGSLNLLVVLSLRRRMESTLSPTQTRKGRAPRLSPSPPPGTSSPVAGSSPGQRCGEGWGRTGRARGQGAQRFRLHPTASARIPGLAPLPPRALPRAWGPQSLLEGLRAACPQLPGPTLPPPHLLAAQHT